MSHVPHFLQIKKDGAYSVISSQIDLRDEYKFLIICDSENEAGNIVAEINIGRLNIPTVNSEGFELIDGAYDYLKPTKVYKLNPELKDKLK